MTLKSWKRYFRFGHLVAFIPFVEIVLFRTAWSVIAVFAYLGYAVFSLRCMNCGLRAVDHRIATHFNGFETLEACPNCGKPMVPTE